jgi:hypothetical protein
MMKRKQTGGDSLMTITLNRPHTSEQRRATVKRRLRAAEIAALDPYQLMAELGKAVIHPGYVVVGGTRA